MDPEGHTHALLAKASNQRAHTRWGTLENSSEMESLTNSPIWERCPHLGYRMVIHNKKKLRRTGSTLWNCIIAAWNKIKGKV
jgi:hypothetical protein